MKYDSPYRHPMLLECSDHDAALYYAIHDTEGAEDVMSPAAYRVVERAVLNWLERPGVLWCKLDIEDAAIEVYLDGPVEGEGNLASYSLPLAELVLASAQTAQDYAGLSPGTVSALLRKLADQIDQEA